MMTIPYDIFRKDLLGTPVWMEAVQDLQAAKLRVVELAARSPGEYFVFCQETQEIVINTAPRSSELALTFPQSGHRISFLI
jgi:hypothetical protein